VASNKSVTTKTEQAHKVEAFPMRDLRFSSLLTILGFACFWSGLISVIASSVFVSLHISDQAGLLLRFVFLLGFALVQFFSYTRLLYRTSEVSLLKTIHMVVAILTLLFFLVAFSSTLGILSPLPFVVEATIWFLFGSSCGLLLVAWGISWTQLDAERPDSHASALGVAASVASAVIMSVFTLFAPQAVSLAAVGISFFASLLLQRYLLTQYPVIENIDIKDSRQRLDLFSRNLLTPLFVGATFGVVMAFASLEEFGFSLLLTVLVGVLLGSITVFCLLLLLRRVPRYSTFERFIFPILGGGLILMPFTEWVFHLVVIVVLIADIVCFFVMHWTVLIMLSYRHHVRASYHYEQGLIAPLGGFALGWGVVGFCAFGLHMPPFSAMLIVALTMVLLLIVVLSIVPYASNKAVEEIASTIEEEIQGKTGPWRRRGELICENYSLTPREKEVFLLLAQGRNTEVIAKRLFISTHTVKTHTARIYRKLSINSQQELIDIVETGT